LKFLFFDVRNENKQKKAIMLPRILALVILVGLTQPGIADVVKDYPSDESTISGTRAGSLSDVLSRDDIYEGLTETQSGGKPNNRRSYLEHEWTVNLTVDAISSIFSVEAWHTANAESDDFTFAYSVDGTNFTNMLTVTDTSDANSVQSYRLPDGLSGSITIKVTDTDDTQGNSSLDTVYIDELYIESDVTPSESSGGIEPVTEFSYRASGMKKSLKINGFQPTGPGSYPIFIWFTGTGMSPWSGDDEIITSLMADRGFVALSVNYSTRQRYPGSCAALSAAAEEVMSMADSNSAINTILASTKADINKGIVVSGFSQGGNMASLTKNYNASVEAAFVIGHGYVEWGADCYKDVDTVLPNNRIRSIMGENDNAFTGYFTDDPRTMLEETTGYSCGSSAMSCTQSNGSGWWLVTSAETADGEDDHCFYYGPGFCGSLPFDANFEDGTYWWSLEPSLDWLSTFVTP
jgi:dienelactone hydrolase